MTSKGSLTKKTIVIGGAVLFGLLFVSGIVAKGAHYDTTATVLFKILLSIILGLFMFLGIGCIMRAALDAMRGIKSKSWPTAKGTIISSMFSEEDVPGGYDSVGYTMYHTNISYDYKVGGISYTSQGITFGSWGTRGSAKEQVLKYTHGMPITVYYNPKNPYLSTLKPGFQPGIFLGLLLGLSLLAGSVGGFIFFFNYL